MIEMFMLGCSLKMDMYFKSEILIINPTLGLLYYGRFRLIFLNPLNIRFRSQYNIKNNAGRKSSLEKAWPCNMTIPSFLIILYTELISPVESNCNDISKPGTIGRKSNHIWVKKLRVMEFWMCLIGSRHLVSENQSLRSRRPFCHLKSEPSN